jgi:hypothetical protein
LICWKSNSSHTASITITLKSCDNKYIYSFSIIHRVWKKLIQKHPCNNFSAELKLKTDFSMRTGCCFARFIYFIIYSYGYLMTSFLLKCMRQAHSDNLCAYYVYENLHGLAGPSKSYPAWELEVSKKTFINVSTHFVNCRN